MTRARFEDAPYLYPPDETDVNLRAYFDSWDTSRAEEVDLAWDDERLRAWDGNFRDDGLLMMVCCDRDVGIGEYRAVLAEFLKFRQSKGPARRRGSRPGSRCEHGE